MKRLLILTLTVTVIVGFSSMAADVGAKETVRIAYVPIIHFGAVYVAAERGYLAEQGIE